jgi:hypothetical protein
MLGNLTRDGVACRSIAASPLFEIALVLVRFDHIASFIVNPNHGIM